MMASNSATKVEDINLGNFNNSSENILGNPDKNGKSVLAWGDRPQRGQGQTRGQVLWADLKEKTLPPPPTWDEFTQSTTFHGVKYIFDKGPLKTRRIIWLLVVLGSILLFVGQVGSRVAVYFEYKSNVAVKVTYVDEITFPSVTICNQNNYRTTATVKWNLYEFIDNVFSANTNLSHLDLSTYPLDVNTSDFITSTAHQKKDLIHRCTWQNKPCDLEKDFNMTVTDLGVCFTFNDQVPAQTTREPGSRSGLSLLLNVEQYEYMRGPQNDAGVKIHLHDQGELPQMKDQGFAVAPGTHTLVAVKRTEIRNLPKPFGDCEDVNPVPVSECQLECKAKQIIQKCGCHDLYMVDHQNESSSSTICRMQQKFVCVPQELERMSQQLSDCNCFVPCKRVQFEQDLSYAQLSKINIERLVIETEQERERLRNKSLDAMETSQKVVKETFNNDNKQITALLNSLKNLVDVFSRSYDQWHNFSILASSLQAPDVLTGDILQKDLAFMNRLYDLMPAAQKVVMDPHFDLLWNRQVPNVEEAMLFSDGGNKSVALEFLLFCNGTIPSMGNSSSPYPWANVQDVSECDDALFELQDMVDSPRDDIWDDLQTVRDNPLQDQYDTYHDQVNNFLSIYTYFDLTKAQFHVSCIGMEQQVIERDNLFTKITELGAELSLSVSYDEAYQYAVQIQELYMERKRRWPDENMYNTVAGHVQYDCDWMQYSVRITEEQLTQYFADFTRIIEDHDAALRTYQSMVSFFDTLYEEVMKTIQPTVNHAQEYLDGTISKLHLAEEFDESLFTKALEDVYVINAEFLSTSKDLVEYFKNGRDKLLAFYKNVFNVVVPVLIPDNIENLRFIAESYFVGEAQLENLAVNVRNNIEVNLPELITEVYRRLTNISKDIPDAMSAVITNEETLGGNLLEFNYLTKMNTDFYVENFMQVDIFYQKISYEEIEQNIAFEFLSLLGEVGGFLGLLLGASILTVCELLDFLTMAVLLKCKKRKETQPEPMA